jgi:putative ABC transport system permease protein
MLPPQRHRGHRGGTEKAIGNRQLAIGNHMSSLIQDLRYGVRTLVKNPAFTFVAAITLALGIGANTAIFSVVNAVLLQPLPYEKPEELVRIDLVGKGPDFQNGGFPLPPAGYLFLKSNNHVFSDMGALSNKGWPANLTGAGDPERLQGFKVSASLFSLLGAKPILGRSFLNEEDQPGSDRVVVLSFELWQRRFGGDRNIVGRTLTLNGFSYAVVGVLPNDFRFYTKTDLWTPLAFDFAEANEAKANYLEVVARRRSDISFQQAATEIDQLSRQYINNPKSDLHARLVEPQAPLTRRVRPTLYLLSAAVGFVLLIACVNIANLTLTRGIMRRRELAIRAALGARRMRVIRQLLIESALVALAGAALGLLAANWIVGFLAAGLPDYLVNANSRVAMLGIDRVALGFTIGLALLTTLLFGLAPALQLSKVKLNEFLKEGSRSTGVRSKFRSALVITEVTLSMVTLIGAALVIKSVWHLTHVNPGYEPIGVLTAQIDPAGENYKEPAQVNLFYKGLLQQLAAVPEVSNVGIINSLNSSTAVSIDEHPPVPAEHRPQTQTNQVSPDYFGAMGIPLRAGRVFNDHDAEGAPPVIVVDESFARREFGSENPIGKHVSFWKKSWEIIGVVGGARYWGLNGEPVPQIYLSYLQENWRSMTLVVRVKSGDPERMISTVRNVLALTDRNQPIHSFKTLTATVSELVAPQKFTALLLAGFAGLSALLSAIGIYGVISHSVAQSTREIGVRIALGARPSNVLRMVIGHGMVLAVTGVVLGLAGSYWLMRLLDTLLFEVKPTDASSFATVSVGLLIVAFVACYIPARRATKVDPLEALRYE